MSAAVVAGVVLAGLVAGYLALRHRDEDEILEAIEAGLMVATEKEVQAAIRARQRRQMRTALRDASRELSRGITAFLGFK